MFNINVIWLSSGGEAFFQELYDSTKHAIPEILQKEFKYSGSETTALAAF